VTSSKVCVPWYVRRLDDLRAKPRHADMLGVRSVEPNVPKTLDVGSEELSIQTGRGGWVGVGCTW
jgi:hypothetical protein